MTKQSTRRRRARCTAARVIAVAGAAALIAVVGAGQTLAATAPPDERVLERQGRVDHGLSVGQADGQGKAQEPSGQKATELPRRWIRPEPPMGPPPQLDDEQVTPAPDREPAAGRGALVAAVAVAALLLAVGAAATWRIRHRHPQPQSTA